MAKRQSKAKSKSNARAKRGAAGEAAHLKGAWAGFTAAMQLAYRNMTATVFALAFVTLVVGYAIGRDTLQQRVANVRSEPVRVEFDWPIWMAGDSATLEQPVRPMAMLEELVLLTVSMDPFDKDSLALAAQRLAETGWLASDVSLRRHTAGRVEIKGTWRIPSAVVEYGSDQFLVGTDGSPMRLPPNATPGDHWYRIVGPSLPPATRTIERNTAGAIEVIAWGQPWPGGDVQDGIELLRLVDESVELRTELRGTRLADRIVAVDLSRYMRTASSELRLHTDLGGTIVWGSPIGQDAPGEVAVGVKLGHIAALLQRGERVDRPGVLLPVTGRVVTIDRVGPGRG